MHSKPDEHGLRVLQKSKNIKGPIKAPWGFAPFEYIQCTLIDGVESDI